MARRKNGNGDGDEFQEDAPRTLSNSKARKETILKACRELAGLLAERKELGEKIGKLKQTLVKGDLGMKIADFNLAFRLYQLEGEDRDQTLDTLKECFGALGIGGQLDWIEAAAAGGGASQPPASGLPGGAPAH